MTIKKLKRLRLIINAKTFVVTLLAVISTYFCSRYNLIANFPITIITTAIVFPVVFSIGGAYKRREVALDEYGVLKSHGRAIYFATRDWLDTPPEETIEKSRQLLGDLFSACRTLFSQPVSQLRQNEEAVYQAFSKLSQFIKNDLRKNGLASGEVSRVNQYLSKMFIAFEDIKHIYQYRTPRTLRAFSDVFITILPPLYGPYFAFVAKEYAPGLQYFMPILFSVILVSLDNIQDHLENPFDQIGEDDVTINVEEFLRRLN